MKHIHEKTLKDLEFDSILTQVASLCATPQGAERIGNLLPITEEEALHTALERTNEYLTSLQSKNTLPTHYFEGISSEIKWLQIENAMLEVGSFRKIKALAETTQAHLLFLKKYEAYFPKLSTFASEVTFFPEIVSEIEKVIDAFGEIRNDASPKLQEIRKEIGEARVKIGQSFARALSHYLNEDYLDDIRETIIDNRRVLAVKAMYRKRVRGTFLGTSKTGSIVYIEPQETEHFSRILLHLMEDEQEEIRRILKLLTARLSPYAENLAHYQEYLTEIDVIAAKAHFALLTNSVLPALTTERELSLIDAYHPLLFLNNQKKQLPTYPQTILLNKERRIIVISGPNAGGKSITLKTIGLLQLMLQSGMLLPVHPKSKCCFFERILTDIGDNQSIENHLSTYSYRLKNMNYFLRKCNAHTLFLIDEFGTGSDPELGGALAETFLEEFYHREAFGVITTHYANLKILADELPHATNANMLFNDRTLEPIYKLIIGEAGSSFTFEVAQKNGIPFGLINRAKKKIASNKVRFDATIARLQKERSQIEKTSSSLKEEETKARQEAERLENLNDKIQHKLSSYQELYDQNQQYIYLGRRINELAERYFETKNRRPLISDFLKLIETENSKRTQKNLLEKQAEKEEKKKIEAEVNKQVEIIRKQKEKEQKRQEKEEKQAQIRLQQTIKIGNRVRIKDSKSVGVIEKIERNKAFVNYGLFTTSVEISQLELVEMSK